jgi:hypothetical protein
VQRSLKDRGENFFLFFALIVGLAKVRSQAQHNAVPTTGTKISSRQVRFARAPIVMKEGHEFVF